MLKIIMENKRDILVAVRFTANEYEQLLDLLEKTPGKKDMSKFIRAKIFEEDLQRRDYRQLLRTMQKVRSDLHHAVRLLEKNANVRQVDEIEKCLEDLSDLKRKLEGADGSYSSGTYERK